MFSPPDRTHNQRTAVIYHIACTGEVTAAAGIGFASVLQCSMSSTMLEDLLERAEEQTRAGDRTKATALLRAAVDGATADLERKPTERTRAVRAVAAYQLATLLLQDATTAKEGDALVWRLGFRLRLADEVLRYDVTLSRPPRRAPNAPRVVDQALSEANLRSLAAIFGRDAPYWPAHEGSDGFYSYNVPLDDAGPLGGFLRALRPAAGVDEATSGEIWAHSREADGAHQLHYDLDEAALRSTGATRSPLKSSVFYLETVDNAGAPTMIMERRLGDHEENAAGWLVAPRRNRLLTFDGSLLHCVVPPLPAPADAARRRITVMVGWWGSNVTVGDPARPSPNRPLGEPAWLPSVSFEEAAATPEPTAPHAVARAWRRIKGREATFGDLASPDVLHAGRFFLRECPSEIDDSVMEAAPKPPAAVEFVDLASLVSAAAPAKKKRRSR